jgi:hypothetical protein
MKYRLHTDAEVGSAWPRCHWVNFDGSVVTWKLDAKQQYDFVSAYAEKPHLALIEADSDAALRVFMKQWGPLRAPESGTESLLWIRSQRNQLAAMARLLEAVGGRSEQLPALLAYLDSVNDTNDTISVRLPFYRRDLEIPGDPDAGVDADLRNWCTSASANVVQQLCVRIIEDFPLTCVPSFRVRRIGRGIAVRASLFINNLNEAVRWMLWQDVFQGVPIQFCRECLSAIRAEDKRSRKFCGWRCAKRNADRRDKARKRAEEKRTKGQKGKR